MTNNFESTTVISEYYKIQGPKMEKIYPIATLVPQCCHGCGSLDFITIDTRTPHPSHIINICENNECQHRARLGMEAFLYSQEHPVLLIEPVTVKVTRSNGNVENDWQINGIFCNRDALPLCYVTKGDSYKMIRGNTILENNPDVKLLKIQEELIEYHLKKL